MTPRIEIALDSRAALGEGPAWDQRTQTLIWVDIPRGEVHRFSPTTGTDTSVRLPVPVGAAIPTVDGGVVVAAGMGVAVLDEASAGLRWLAHAEHGDRMNDAACDPSGRLWAGTLTTTQRFGRSRLYRLDGAILTAVLSDVTISNGLGWSPDGRTMYYIDTATERIDAFDYDPATGAICRRRPFVDLHDALGRPDGLAVDAAGGVWVAMAKGGSVRRFDADGNADEVIDVGTPMVTSCGFGGPDLRDLYLTTGRGDSHESDPADDPRAGALLRIRDLAVPGLPTNRFVA